MMRNPTQLTTFAIGLILLLSSSTIVDGQQSGCIKVSNSRFCRNFPINLARNVSSLYASLNLTAPSIPASQNNGTALLDDIHMPALLRGQDIVHQRILSCKKGNITERWFLSIMCSALASYSSRNGCQQDGPGICASTAAEFAQSAVESTQSPGNTCSANSTAAVPQLVRSVAFPNSAAPVQKNGSTPKEMTFTAPADTAGCVTGSQIEGPQFCGYPNINMACRGGCVPDKGQEVMQEACKRVGEPYTPRVNIKGNQDTTQNPKEEEPTGLLKLFKGDKKTMYIVIGCVSFAVIFLIAVVIYVIVKSRRKRKQAAEIVPAKKEEYGGPMDSYNRQYSPKSPDQPSIQPPFQTQLMNQPQFDRPVSMTSRKGTMRSIPSFISTLPRGGNGGNPEDNDIQVNKIYRAIHYYDPQMDDEVQLEIDDQVLVSKVFGDGYCFGTVLTTNDEGVFPCMCLDVMSGISPDGRNVNLSEIDRPTTHYVSYSNI